MGTEADVFAYSIITGNRGDDLVDRVIYLMLRLFEGMGYEQKKYRKYIFFNDYNSNIPIILEQETGFCSQSQFFYQFHLNTKHLFIIILEQAENFYPLPQIPTTTI